MCEQARSEVAGLRLNSMWALKHLVWGADTELRKRAVDRLTPGLLVRLITADTEDENLFRRMRSQEDSNDEDEDMDGDDCGDGNKPWTWPAMKEFESVAAGFMRPAVPARMLQAEKKLLALRSRDVELNPERRARNNDLAIQEQGLHLIQNLISLPPSAEGYETAAGQVEMVDYVFDQLGKDRLFEIMAQKLRIKVLHPFARRSSSGPLGHSSNPRAGSVGANDSRVLYPQAKMIGAVVGILVHVAASIPRHRQLVMAQTELLKLLVNHFNNRDAEVRKQLCWMLNNLALQENGADRADCAQRTQELRRLGFLSKLEGLEQGDGELDVRERAKLAAHELKKEPLA